MKMMIRIAVLMVVAVTVAVEAQAGGELMVHPTRIVLDGKTRTAQLDLINSGTEPTTYRISIIRRRMTETGDFVTVDTPLEEEQFADQMIRFSPRQVVLEPGVAQAVRLQLRKPPGLEEGEYRSHLLFQALPAAAPAAVDSESTGESLDIRLIPIYSLSIPVIVRQGTTSAGISISDVSLRRGKNAPPAVALTLNRTGSRSVYGDLTISVVSPTGVERVIGRANGVAVYTPNTLRRAIVALPALTAGIPPGQLRVTFAERPEQAGRVQSESRIALP